MCTVVFIPVKGNYHFASLRDENPVRLQEIFPSFIKEDNGSYLAPIDPLGGGTWLGTNGYGNVIILLNGGFKNHTKEKKYAKSRGIIVTELLAASKPVVEWNLLDLNNIEPFTLIVWSEGNLFQLVWDGNQKHRINLPKSEAHIWSSSTLYSADVKKYRTQLFNKWISTAPDVSKKSLLNFFSAYNDNYNGFLMNRNEKVKTLSYTFITLQKENATIINYHNFSSGREYNSRITLITSKNNCLSQF